MKFAREFQASLEQGNFPADWINRAIPYAQLKKVLKRVREELRSLDLNPDTLGQLLDANTTDSPLAVSYKLLDPDSDNVIRPRLTALVLVRDGQVVDASLSPSSRAFLRKIAPQLPLDGRFPSEPWQKLRKLEKQAQQSSSNLSDHLRTLSVSDEEPSRSEDVGKDLNGRDKIERVQVHMVCDEEFFALLQAENAGLQAIKALQDDEHAKLSRDIARLRDQISQLTKPPRPLTFSKSDLSRWRAIFELYVDAQVFVASREQDHGVRPARQALERLKTFQDEVERRQLAKKFKLRDSQGALDNFVDVNVKMFKMIEFSELNQMAVRKIMKKFDKMTALQVSRVFPTMAHADPLAIERLAINARDRISTELVSIVPLPSDYSCPVCTNIAHPPVRVSGCAHVICLDCGVRLQAKETRLCPICRNDGLGATNNTHIDRERAAFQRKHFAKEIREKGKEERKQDHIDKFGVLADSTAFRR